MHSYLESTECGDEIGLAVPRILVLRQTAHNLHTLQHINDVIDSAPLYICKQNNSVRINKAD